ncbi:rhamnulokinase [Paenibacillus alkaliterrae]|uniref:rhamnulokinase n=1 Tax=Paenibacillus alkaliterrae TaxID=320909 RepID=UPI001F43FD51|nr:rhamnulokinase family protein [Paenibacillus alkaliterrae]MCF2938693.1 rhamnulokinase [Paenibacillus alkaliterrae]
MTKLATVLAFDLGASSGRALIGELTGDAMNGQAKLQVTEIHRFPNQPIAVGGHLHWDILRLLQELKNAIRKAFQEGYEPQTFGIDTWGVDFGLLDANGELLGNPYHYRDPQTDGIVEELGELIGKSCLYEQGGLQFMPFNTINQLYAMRKAESPKLAAASTLLLTPDLLAYFLTGEKVCEFTMATTTQLFHPEEQAWNTALMERLGIPSRLFIEPIHPGTRIGPLTPEVCAELDVPPIEAVAVGTHDTESAIAAVPAAAGAPFAYLVCGTWSLLGTELEQPIVTPEAMALDFSNEGGVGGTYQLLKNIMGLWILQECKREWDEQGAAVSFAELVKLAENVKPFRSFIQPDASSFYAPSGMVSRIQSYCRETSQPVPESMGEVTRCVLESLALRYRQALEQMEALTGVAYSGLHMVGGGIQNELLCQFTANALGRPVWTGPVEASAIGNMLMQLVALGQCMDLQAARQLSALSFPVDTYASVQSDEWEVAYKTFAGLSSIK